MTNPLPDDIMQEADEVARQCFFPDDDVFECCKGIIAAALLAERRKTAAACVEIARENNGITKWGNFDYGPNTSSAIVAAISSAFLDPSQEQEASR